jgi:uncharacterized protein YjbJ (UPF0337 family)
MLPGITRENLLERNFAIVKTNTETLGSRFKQYLGRLVTGLLMLVLAWQGTVMAGDMAATGNQAIAAPLLATSADSMSKQVTGKADVVKGKAKQAIGKAQSGMEDQARSVKDKVKDDLTETKIAIDSNNSRAENTADKAKDKVKGFFGK